MPVACMCDRHFLLRRWIGRICCDNIGYMFVNKDDGLVYVKTDGATMISKRVELFEGLCTWSRRRGLYVIMNLKEGE